MDIMSSFPSNYVKASDLQGREIEVAMTVVAVEEIGGDRLPVLYFQGAEKGLVLNKTNATNISLIYGQDTDRWAGQRVVLYPATTDFQGRTVPCIRVRGPAKPAGAFGHQAPLHPPAQQARQPEPAFAGGGGQTPFDGADPLEGDSIPFITRWGVR